MLDISLLVAMLDRKNFNLLTPYIPKGGEVLSPASNDVLLWLRNFYNRNPERTGLTVRELQSYIKVRAANQDPERLEVTLELVGRLNRTPQANSFSLLETLVERVAAGEAGAALASYERGDEVDVVQALGDILDRAKNALGGIGSHFDEVDIEEALQADEGTHNFKLKGLKLLEDHISFMGIGDSFGFAGRPDSGKTSTLCRLITSSAEGVLKMFGEGRPIVIMINEGNIRNWKTRLYQSALQCTARELKTYAQEGTLTKLFEEATGVPHTYIQLKNISGWSTRDVENFTERTRAGFRVIDMLEHIEMPGVFDKVERIASLWEWVRMVNLKQDGCSLSTIQINAEGANVMYPDFEALNYSKTAVQAATDVLIMMGDQRGRVGMENIRGFSTPKNKRKVEGMTGYAKGQAIFHPDTCTFEEGIES